MKNEKISWMVWNYHLDDERTLNHLRYWNKYSFREVSYINNRINLFINSQISDEYLLHLLNKYKKL